jgi:hypothetical protein
MSATSYYPVTYCYVVFIKTSSEVSIAFPWGGDQLTGVAVPDEEEYQYSTLDRDTLTYGPITSGIHYRARINGVSTPRKMDPHYAWQYSGAAKYKLIQLHRIVGGVFMCQVIDTTKDQELLINLYEPITGESVAKALTT